MTNFVTFVLNRDKVNYVGGEDSQRKVDKQQNNTCWKFISENEKKKANQKQQEGNDLHKHGCNQRVSQIVHVVHSNELVAEENANHRNDVHDNARND